MSNKNERSIICKGPAGYDAQKFMEHMFGADDDRMELLADGRRWNVSRRNPRFKVTISVEFLDFEMLDKNPRRKEFSNDNGRKIQTTVIGNSVSVG